jgi:hypothetical protein
VKENIQEIDASLLLVVKPAPLAADGLKREDFVAAFLQNRQVD